MVKTVTLTADTPQKVTFEGAYSYYWIDNKTASDVYASVGVPEADADGTYTVAAGSQLRISVGVGNNGITLLGEGKVQVVASAIAACPFKQAQKGGGDGDYSKPDGGIPKSDLAADVRASLDKADTALQEHQSLTGYVKSDDERLTNARPANGGNADTVNGHTVNADVPADAVFTDTTYEPATSSTDGLMSAEDKKKFDGFLSGDDSTSSYYIQSGTVTVTSSIRTGTSITFPKAFKSTPLLALTASFNLISGGGSNPAPKILGYGDLTAAGFTLYPFALSTTGEKYSQNAMVGTARWFAMGKV